MRSTSGGGIHNDLLASTQETQLLIVPAPATIVGRGGMMRSATSRTGESNHSLKKKNIAEAKQRSTPILGLDLNSGLGLKGSSEQVEEPFVGEFHRSEQNVAGRDG